MCGGFEMCVLCKKQLKLGDFMSKGLKMARSERRLVLFVGYVCRRLGVCENV